MVVSGDKVFLHIAKCGGTYFRRLLADNGVQNAFRYWKLPTVADDDLGHLNMGNFHIHLKPGSYHLHTMMRHPYDRFLSSWQYVKTEFSNPPSPPLGISEEEILEHCDSPGQLANFLLENPRCLFERTCPWLHPQFLYVDERVEVYAYEKKEDWQRLAHEFELPENTLSGLEIKRYPITKALEKIIQKVYAQDYELYKLLNERKKNP